MFPSARVPGDGQGSSKDIVRCKADSTSNAGGPAVEEPAAFVAVEEPGFFVAEDEGEMAISGSEEGSEGDSGQDTDDELMEPEWKDAARVLLDLTMFQVQQNMAFLEEEEDESPSNNFLKVAANLLGSDPGLGLILRSLIQVTKDSYLTPETQNEFLRNLGDHVKQVLVKDIQSAGIFGVLFDTLCEPDTDVMSTVIRYVKIDNGKAEVKEVFLGLYPINRKTASELTSDILNGLESDGLDIMKCRAQGYDSSTLMAGVSGGMRAIIEEKNKKAVFTSDADHFDLCASRCFSENADFGGSLGKLKMLFSLFADSPPLWDILISHTGVPMERLPTTCWEVDYAAVELLADKFDEVVAALVAVQDSSLPAEFRGKAGMLLEFVADFTFLCFVNVWCSVLREVSVTQNYLQKKASSVHLVLTAIKAQSIFLQEQRVHLAEKACKRARLKADEYDIPVQRKRRSLKEVAPDAGLSVEEEMKGAMLKCIDRFDSELQVRSRGLQEVGAMFEAVQVKSLLSATDEELQVSIPKLTAFYDEVSESELLKEILRLRRYLRESAINLEEAKKWTLLDVLTRIVEWDFVDFYPNLSLSLKLFLTIGGPAALCKRNFSKLKSIKDYLQSPLAKLKLPGLAMMLIENELVRDINFDEVIEKLATLKAMEGML